jgi:cell division protein FtsZ
VQEALKSPLLNDNNISGACNILINITSGADEATMDEIGQITDYIQSCAGDDADVIWGNGIDEKLGDALSVTLIATGFETNSIPELYIRKRQIDKVPIDNTFMLDEQEKPVQSTEFEVRDKKSTSKRDNNVITQRTIEFDMTDDLFTVQDKPNKLEKSIETKRAAERVKTIKRNYEQMRELNLSNRQRQSNIEDLENQPAYVRKNIQLDNSKISIEKKVSKYSLENDEEEGGVKLSDNNRYLHENVD